MKSFFHNIRFVSRALLFAYALPLIALADTGILNSPLNTAVSTIPKFIAGFLQILVVVALPILTLFIVISGFKFITAQGNETKLANAKQNFMYVILGSLLILGAWVIATLIAGTVAQLTATS